MKTYECRRCGKTFRTGYGSAVRRLCLRCDWEFEGFEWECLFNPVLRRETIDLSEARRVTLWIKKYARRILRPEEVSYHVLPVKEAEGR